MRAGWRSRLTVPVVDHVVQGVPAADRAGPPHVMPTACSWFRPGRTASTAWPQNCPSPQRRTARRSTVTCSDPAGGHGRAADGLLIKTAVGAPRAAQQHRANVIGMSGLLVKPTVVMKENLRDEHRGLSGTPVILGGAAMTRAYVEQDLDDVFDGEVAYARDAFEGASAAVRGTGGLAGRVQAGEAAGARFPPSTGHLRCGAAARGGQAGWPTSAWTTCRTRGDYGLSRRGRAARTARPHHSRRPVAGCGVHPCLHGKSRCTAMVKS